MKTFLRKLFAAKPTAPAKRTARLGMEALEAREVPAAGTAVLANGVLTVTGTDRADAIAVVQSHSTSTHGVIRLVGGTIKVDGAARAEVPDYLVQKVVINGLGGNDDLSVRRPMLVTPGYPVNGNIAVTLNGGSGANTYTRTRGWDVIDDPVLTAGRAMPRAVMSKWAGLGGVAGLLGAPTTDVAAAGAGKVVHFRGGSVYYSPATGARVVHGVFRARYDALGGAAGFLGLPTSDREDVPGGKVSRFQGGDIYATGGGLHVIHGAIRARYDALGGARGRVGVPTSGVQNVTGGQVVRFTGADIYTSAAGTFVVEGLIRVKYDALAWQTDATGRSVRAGYGMPTSDEENVWGRNGQWLGKVSRFQGGDIYWSGGATEAYAVYGAIKQNYDAWGGPAGWAGMPTSDEGAVPNGRVSRFQGADIYWSPSTGAHRVGGLVREAYNAVGGARSWLGLPTTDEYRSRTFNAFWPWETNRSFWANSFQGGMVGVYMDNYERFYE